MRLIDADALSEKLCETTIFIKDGEVFQRMINDAPTIDAVPVVRCKDCKHRRENCGMGDHRWCDVLKMTTRADDFCSYGKRREDGEA